MDKIYSRKRIQMPKLYFSKFPNNKIDIRKRITFKIVLILIIAIAVMFIIINSVNPILNKLCLDVSKNKATMISNKKVSEVMSKYTYDDIITIYRDNNNNISMIKSNISVINEITSNVAIEVQQELERDNESKTYIKLGSIFGTKILSGVGPSIPIKLSTTGTVTTSLRSKFESSGINQTIHKLYLDVECDVSILTPYDIIEESIKNEIVLAENVIVGLVPNTYYNLEGMQKSDLVDIVE